MDADQHTDDEAGMFFQRVEFLLSSVWATYAFRSRVRERVWKAVMPGYEDFEERVNDNRMRRTNE